ncbi:MAG: cell division topological specificity factor MinE [Roseiflexaceae bacterium]|nr:cell division topological specificity factor MinE [Roseiflexaceae bacterium]
MSLFDKLFRGRQERSSDVARERLLTVLVHDRVKLTPEIMAKMKAELAEVVARYIPGANPDEIDVTLMRGESNDHIKADIPLRRSAN